jgi:hypothetical protein
MPDKSTSELRAELHELSGAVDILTLLREEMEQWLEEAQDVSKQETLENVVGHLEALEVEYSRRHKAAKEQLEK